MKVKLSKFGPKQNHDKMAKFDTSQTFLRCFQIEITEHGTFCSKIFTKIHV